MTTTQATVGLTKEQQAKLEAHQKSCVYCFAESKGVDAKLLEESAMVLWQAWAIHERLFTELGLMRVA